MPIFIDTNVLIYSIGTAPEEAAKREQALKLLNRLDCVLSVQVLQEFYNQVTRASRKGAVPHDVAVRLIRGLQRFHVEENTLATFELALALRQTTNFAFWDCAIIAAANAAGCSELYTEDMAHGQRVGGTTIINPFL